MEDLGPSILTPGIRKTVLWLRSHGYDTTDSGDGVTNVEAGMECALDIPHVCMMTTPLKMVAASRNLLDLVTSVGIKAEQGMIEASYDPVSGVALLMLYGVDDKMLP